MSTLDSSRQSRVTYCGSAANTAKSILREAPTLKNLSAQLTESLRKPGRKTLSLINKALSYLTPFESPKATVASPTERRDLLALLDSHRMVLTPYLDVDLIECNLRRS